MTKFILALDRAILPIIDKIVGVAAILLTLITVVQVFTRYVFHISIGGIGELPVYFMMVCIWMTAATAVRKKDHIKVDFFGVFIKNQAFNQGLQFIIDIISLVIVIIFTKLSFDYVLITMARGNTSAGLRFPLWWLASIVFVSGLLMSIYYIGIVYHNIRMVKK